MPASINPVLFSIDKTKLYEIFLISPVRSALFREIGETHVFVLGAGTAERGGCITGWSMMRTIHREAGPSTERH